LRRLLIYVAGRLVLVATAAFAVSGTVFLLVHALPGSPFSGSDRITDAREQALLHRAHLDEPYPQQYFRWLESYFHGGVAPQLQSEAWISVRLGLLAMALLLTLGIWMGVLSATRRGGWADMLLSVVSSTIYSIPNFVWGIGLVFLFSALLYRWTDGIVYYDLGWGQPHQWILPAVALGLPPAGLVARIVRASVLDALGQDYIRTAWAKGLQQRAVIMRHAFRNALIPLVSALGPIAVSVLVGSVVVERIFGVPGLGNELVRTIFGRQYFLATGVFTYYSLLAGLANLAVDLAYAAIDPKVRYL
jgi:ABC-type dipeptide/oligopeptide/nickel transport system permease component